MANEKSTLSKSDSVLQYLANKPTASVHQIVVDLAPYRISEALAGKIKYSERREAPTKGHGRKPRSAKPAVPAPAAAGTKAAPIRAVAKSLPKPFRPLTCAPNWPSKASKPRPRSSARCSGARA